MSSRPAATPQASIWAFLVPSLLGVFLFMTPVVWQDQVSIPVAIMAKSLVQLLGSALVPMIVGIICATALGSIWARLFKPRSLARFRFVHSLLMPSRPWFVVRLLGALAVLLTFFQWGPAAIWSLDTGGLVLYELLPTLFSVFIFAGLLLPLLLSFGLLELLGSLMTRIMRPLFGLPGRSAVDCMASWLGDGSVGILLSSQQYQQKFYTQREAAVVGTTFSAVSITFTLVVLTQVSLEHMFLPFYLTICTASFVAALVVPRLPPLRWKKDLLIDGSVRSSDPDLLPAGFSSWGWGLVCARQKAATVVSWRQVFAQGGKNALDMVFGVLPVIMAIGTLALVVSEHSDLFSILGTPFVPLLELLRIPEAAKASETMVVGFADMFIPAILAASIESELTRFVVAALSVTQLIYMSEVGALLLGSKIPVNLWELFVIFILRTLITLPIIALMAHWIF